MAASKYQISLNDFFTGHGLQPGGLVHDIELQLNKMQVDALAASGDCFETLATELDRVAELLPDKDPRHIKLELEKLTRLLLYLQQHYAVNRKAS